ncbi:MAG TPA: tryptophan synthase subunit alpha [Chitinophagaceae bacterium]|nr:tryptophan synthase subunit alpha [Chitinophagaceae bacterium]
MNRIDQLFADKDSQILSVYFTAGYPRLNDTRGILEALQEHGADLTEVGIPFSDPIADGPVIQESGSRALSQGMTLELLFSQLRDCRKTIRIPILLMGYLNPVLQFGMDRFVRCCVETGIDGVILPDLPLEEYEIHYRKKFQEQGLHLVFMITPETGPERIGAIDRATGGFLYLVSSSSTTGKGKDLDRQQNYFERVSRMGLTHPLLTGFGIRDRESFLKACSHTRGAVIGTAFIQALSGPGDPARATADFLAGILGQSRTGGSKSR